MFIATTKKEIQGFLKNYKGIPIAFVPTMGALHEGHLSLIEKAKQITPIVISSIFVNKTQFNDKSDYLKYPRDIESDLKKLNSTGVNCVFAPEEKEIFPRIPYFEFQIKELDKCLCGANREGHFNGVALIITKLFNIIKPDYAIFGEKDFQQLIIIKKLVEDFDFETKIISKETVRDKNGLALSSRNKRLSEDQLKIASNIFASLNDIKENPESILLWENRLINLGFESVEYIEIRKELDLSLIADKHKIHLDLNQENLSNTRIFVAAYLGGVRLIDNISLNLY